MRHVHADLIIAWAEGAKIERQQVDGSWTYINRLSWHSDAAYRIKPREPRRRWINIYPDIDGALHKSKDAARSYLSENGETVEFLEVMPDE